MKRTLFIAYLVFIALATQAQMVDNPVSWEYKTKKVDEGKVDLIFEGKIKGNWYLYGTDFPSGGPVRTNLNFEDSDTFKKVGDITAITPPKTKYDSLFEMETEIFRREVKLRQRIKVLSSQDFSVTGNIEYQVCQEERCVLFSPDFTFDVSGVSESAISEDEETDDTQAKPGETGQSSENVSSEKSRDSGKSKAQTKTVSEEESVADAGKETTAESDKNIKQTVQNPHFQGKSLWGLFWISFLAGLLAIFTPCVFPMIPMTVTFFMKGSPSKAQGRFQASIYGLSIILIYTVIGTIVAVTLGASFANFLSTHWIPNVLFFLIFFTFAISFLGAFEITLPGWMINSADSQSTKGGVTGSFFMAFTLVLVSFSCTGPLVGAILVASAGGDVIEPVIGMFGFSLAFALPFTVLAFFPQWISNLPQSGGWLNSVKVVLGFLELALGLKFLSIADQTYHWGLLDRHIYLILWIVIFAIIGVYLLGKIRMPGDSKLEKVSVTRMMLSIVTFSFVLYMIPGLFGAPLKALSGYLPPQSTQDFDITRLVRENQSASQTQGTAHPTMCGDPKYGDFLEIPHGLKGYFDYEQGLKCAQKLDKPVFLDFTGHGCVNCREMEARVWPDQRVLKRLREDYVIISLYIDDKTKLSESEWVERDGEVKKTLGDKYASFQISRFGVNAQPYYVLLNPQGEKLVEPKAYDLNVDNFVEFLDKGKEAFKKQQAPDE